MPFAEPDSAGRLNPRDIVGHLLLVWPTKYINHAPTKYSRPDKPSDAIQVDVVDLDMEDPNTGLPGYLVVDCWWRPSKLIQSLRGRVGSKDPMLAIMGTGTASQGMNAPFILVSATKDEKAVARGEEWLARNPEFSPTVVQEGSQDVTPTPPVERVETALERLARMSREGADRLPKPPDSSDIPF